MLKFIPYQEFTIAVLLYGDYLDLAKRCLEPILEIDEPYNLFIATNAISENTKNYLSNIKNQLTIHNKVNEYKYPVLKKLIQASNSKYFMWFDDDSYLKKPKGFLTKVKSNMNADMIGWIYQNHPRGKQREWIKKQKWYSGKDIEEPTKFIHGSWWTATKEVLLESGWPWDGVKHRGGDIAMGFWMHQQNKIMSEFTEDIVFNMASRRGFDEQPVGFLG